MNKIKQKPCPSVSPLFDLGVAKYQTSPSPGCARHGHAHQIRYRVAETQRQRESNGKDVGREITMPVGLVQILSLGCRQPPASPPLLRCSKPPVANLLYCSKQRRFVWYFFFFLFLVLDLSLIAASFFLSSILFVVDQLSPLQLFHFVSSDFV